MGWSFEVSLIMDLRNCFSRWLFFSGDMLGGHLDDMEADWSKPIVSMRYHVFFVNLPKQKFKYHSGA